MVLLWYSFNSFLHYQINHTTRLRIEQFVASPAVSTKTTILNKLLICLDIWTDEQVLEEVYAGRFTASYPLHSVNSRFPNTVKQTNYTYY